MDSVLYPVKPKEPKKIGRMPKYNTNWISPNSDLTGAQAIGILSRRFCLKKNILAANSLTLRLP
jgi:hypothetical protein